jgi:outer membrane murein-binding lipoprotein Lpp
MVRIEEKVDQTNSDVRELIRAIHEQSVAMVRLTEQMKNSQEAVDRAHKRIDTVSGKVEELHDLPLRVAYMEKNIASIEQKHGATEGKTVENMMDLARRAGSTSILQKYGWFIFLGALVLGLAAVGKMG